MWKFLVAGLLFLSVHVGSEAYAASVCYNENFDDPGLNKKELPDGWKSEGATKMQIWHGEYVSGKKAYSGDYIIGLSNNMTWRDETVYTCAINMQAGTEYKLSFQLYMPGGSNTSVFNNNLTVSIGQEQTQTGGKLLFETGMVALSDWTRQECAFTPETAGDYYFAFRVQSSAPNNCGPIAIDDVMVECDEKEEIPAIGVPYKIDFGESQEGWTTIDNSEIPGKTWIFHDKAGYQLGEYYAGIIMDQDYSSLYNDYYVSPAMQLEAGEYIIKTLAFNSMSGPELSLHIGTSATDCSTFRKIGDLQLKTNYDAQAIETNKVTVETGGVYHIAFLGITKEQWSSAKCSIFSFSISKEGEEPEPEPEPESVYAVIPYEINFNDSIAKWTAVDHNKDNITWEFTKRMGAVVDNYWENNDDLISPIFTLEGGKKYKINTVLSLFPNGGETCILMAGQEKDYLTEVQQLSLAEFGENKEETLFVPEASGEYYFAFRNTYGNYFLNYFSIVEIKDTPIEPSAPIFSTDFSGANPMEGWTVLDVNNDKVKWSIVEGSAGITYNGMVAPAAADDWLITPALVMQQGQDYLIKYTLTQSSAFDPDQIAIYCGDAATTEGMQTLLAEESIECDAGSGTVSKVCRLSCSQAEDVYVGFRIFTPDMNGKLSLTHIEIAPVEKAIPLSVEELLVSSNREDALVTLKWMNPTFDTRQTPINVPMTAKIYENGNLVQEVDDMIAGEEGTYTYYPENFVGVVTYKVTVMIGENESQPVSYTINLDDLQGELILVRSFSDVNSGNAQDWLTENIAGTSVWAYDYANIFSLNYKLGQKNENDWLISPVITMEVGKRYIAKYELKTSSSSGADFDITIGMEQLSSGQQRIINSHKSLLHNGFGQFETKQFTVDVNSGYYIGFHTTNVDYSLSMRNLEIYYVSETGPSGVNEMHPLNDYYFIAETSTLVVPSVSGTLTIHDAQGRLVLKNRIESTNIDLSVLKEGFYCVQIRNDEGQTSSLKIVR